MPSKSTHNSSLKEEDHIIQGLCYWVYSKNAKLGLGLAAVSSAAPSARCAGGGYPSGGRVTGGSRMGCCGGRGANGWYEMEEFKGLRNMVFGLQVLLGFAGWNKSRRKHDLLQKVLHLLKGSCSPAAQTEIWELYKHRHPRTLKDFLIWP